MMQKPLFPNILRRVTSSIETRYFSSENSFPKTRGSSNPKIKHEKKGLRTFIPEDCPKDPTLILFPGQGAQFVGMAKSLVNIPAAVDLFEIASDVLRLVPKESKGFRRS